MCIWNVAFQGATKTHSRKTTQDPANPAYFLHSSLFQVQADVLKVGFQPKTMEIPNGR